MMKLLIIAFIILSVQTAWLETSNDQIVSSRSFSCQFSSTDGRSYDLSNIRPSGGADPRSKVALKFCNPEPNPMKHPDKYFFNSLDLSDTILEEVWSNTHGLLYFSIRRPDSRYLRSFVENQHVINKALLGCGKIENALIKNEVVSVFSPTFCPTNTFEDQESLSLEEIASFLYIISTPASFESGVADRSRKYEERLQKEKKRKEVIEAIANEKKAAEARRVAEEKKTPNERQVTADVNWLNCLLGLVLLVSGSVLIFFGRTHPVLSNAVLGAACFAGASIFGEIISWHHGPLDAIPPSFYLIVILSCLLGSAFGVLISKIPEYTGKYYAVVYSIGLVGLLAWLPCYHLITHFAADYALFLVALHSALCLFLAYLAIKQTIYLHREMNLISFNLQGCLSVLLSIRILTDNIYLPLSFDDELGFIARSTTHLTFSLSLMVNALAILEMIHSFNEMAKEDNQ